VSGVPREESDQLSSRLFTVAADGTVTLPYIDPVAVAGLTLGQAERAIEREYLAQKIYRFPTITIQYRPSDFDPRRSQQPSNSPGPLDAPGPGYRTHIRPLHVAFLNDQGA
jgi:Polysaccharide biosynthesis/export protein